MRAAYRARALLMVVLTGVALAYPAGAVDPLNPNAPCSVFDGRPCTPSFCGVFDPWPCVTVNPSIGQDRRLTIHTRASEAGRAPEGPVNSIPDLFAALRACWEPPPLNKSFRGMQMSVRFSYKRTGDLVAPPRVTYTSSEANPEIKRSYGRAVDAALARCTPMPFSRQMGAAIAGRPIAIRFIDERPAD